MIPPPNITGQLHMGHALDETMQDILIRYKRMSGFETLWLPGTDHASIATEVKVVNKLAAEGISKTDIGREGFLEHAWAWKKEYGGRIVTQLRKLGSSCDWERERFTMDDGCSRAVTKVFVDLYKKGLIYRAIASSTGVRTAKRRFPMRRLILLNSPAIFGMFAMMHRTAAIPSSAQRPARKPSSATQA